MTNARPQASSPQPQAPVTCAYQGLPGAFSEDAALAFVGAHAALRPCPTLADVFEALAAGRVRRAVVPIENSLAGRVPGCAELIARHDARIIGERAHPIRQALVAPAGVAVGAVRRVLSHPVAIAQCGRFFRAHPALAAVPVFDTAGAVAEITRSRATDAAAIASRRAADLYGAVILLDDIQDRPDNVTRFLLIELWLQPGEEIVLENYSSQPVMLTKVRREDR